MRAIIGSKLLGSAQTRPGSKPFEIRDTRLRGFILRVQPSGNRSFIAQVARSRRITIGPVGHFTADEARERCEKILGNVAHGRPALFGIEGADGPTLGEFITDVYGPWVEANRPRSAADSLARLKRHFNGWYSLPIVSITLDRLESWRGARLRAGKSSTTVQRDLAALSAVLSRATKLERIRENPLKRMDKPRIDRIALVRFLDTDEEQRLRTALENRDAEMARARLSANAWRGERKKDVLPEILHFGDHLTPAVLLSMNTGLRRGELLGLTWDRVDLLNKVLTVVGSTSKSGQTRHVPLNDEALSVLKKWREQNPDAVRVFYIDTGFKSAWRTLLNASEIAKFRWHDLRHHFASKLAQAGVPLNTIRELLGHASLAMTIRYAHLAPDQKREAVALLIKSSSGTK